MVEVPDFALQAMKRRMSQSPSGKKPRTAGEHNPFGTPESSNTATIPMHSPQDLEATTPHGGTNKGASTSNAKAPDSSSSSTGMSQGVAAAVQAKQSNKNVPALFARQLSKSKIKSSSSKGGGSANDTKLNTSSSSSNNSNSKAGSTSSAGSAVSASAQQRITQLEEQVAQLTKQNQSLKDSVIHQEKEVGQLHRENMAKEQKMHGEEMQVRDVITELVVAQAAAELKNMRSQVEQSKMRLGRITLKLKDGQMAESWEEGTAFRDVNERLQDIAVERASIEQQRKELAKGKKEAKRNEERVLKASASASGADMPPPPAPTIGASQRTMAIQDEIYRLRLATLRQDEDGVKKELEQLEAQRSVHIRLLRRLRDHDNSRFSTPRTILNNRYVLLYLLGKGGFSEVHKAFDLENKQYCACKIHQLNENWPQEKKASYTRHAVREYNIHTKLKHPHIVLLHDVFELEADKSFCTTLEFCEGGDLDQHLKAVSTMPEREAKSVIVQLFSALAYLQTLDEKIIHYDLKPGNLLYNKGQVKLTDFGLSKIMQDVEHDDGMELTSMGAGTYWYLPPEVFQRAEGGAAPKINSKVDVFSAGVIFYQMLYGKKPFGQNMTQQHIMMYKSIWAQELVFPPTPKVSAEAKDFISQCLKTSKLERPDVLEICKHNYLNIKT